MSQTAPMARMMRIFAAGSVALCLLWSQLFEKTPWHWLGDADISRWLHYSGRWFYENRWKTYGLPMYPNLQMAYTHITSGPDLIQAFFAALRPAGAPEFQWHAALTAIVSLACVYFSFASLRVIAERMLGKTVESEVTRLVLLLVLSSASMQVFAGQPYCMGLFVAETANLAAIAWWCRSPGKWRAAALLFSFSIFVSFWMGIAPIVSSAVWCLAAAWRFGPAERRLARIRGLLIAFAAAVVVCSALKIYQNYLYLGSLKAVWDDAFGILKLRQGLGDTKEFAELIKARGGLSYDVEYGAFRHLLKIIGRTVYLFGLLGPLLVYLSARRKNELAGSDRIFLGLAILGGFGWQILMRHHAYHHLYMLRLLLFPLAFAVMVLLSLKREEKLERYALYLIPLQALVLWGGFLLPAIL